MTFTAMGRDSAKQIYVTHIQGFAQQQRQFEMISQSITRLTFEFSLPTGICINVNIGKVSVISWRVLVKYQYRFEIGLSVVHVLG